MTRYILPPHSLAAYVLSGLLLATTLTGCDAEGPSEGGATTEAAMSAVKAESYHALRATTR